MLKWLTKKVYNSLSEVLGAVYKELDSLQPVDTDTVKWTKSLNGMKAHAVVQNSPVATNQVQEDSIIEEYSGAFKVGYIDDKLYVYDGSAQESSYAGVVYAGATQIQVLKTEIEKISGYVYLIVTYVPETSLYTSSFSRQLPSDSTRTVSYRIANINTSLSIIQLHSTDDITITGRWV